MSADPNYPVGFHVRQDGTAHVPSGANIDIEAGGEFRIGGTAVTPSAAEMNILHGVTPGTNTASKALVTDAAKAIDELRTAALYYGAGAGTALSFTAAQFNQIMAAAGAVNFDRSLKIAEVALASLDTAGGVLAWANPEAGSILVTRVIVDVTTKSIGACTLDIGTTAVSAATLSDTLLDGIDVGTAAGVFDNMLAANAGTNGLTALKLATGKWVTGSKASGAAAGLVGFAYIHYINI